MAKILLTDNDIGDILAGRMELIATDFELSDLLASLGSTFELLATQQGLVWRLESVEETSLWVHGDEGKLRQVLINLLGNAVKFTQEGEVVLGLQRTGGAGYAFTVSDTGPGISDQEQQTLFEAFQQGSAGQQRGGTGLGLALSHYFVTLMGGQLRVDSALGQGSRFSFELGLPAVESQVSSEPTPWAQVQHLAPGYEVEVLIADDVVENRQVLAGLLQDIGVQVRQAADGQQALDAVAEKTPDLVFMDIRMPVLDGVAALQQIRNRAEWVV